MHTIIAGSILPPNRLKHTGIISDDKCNHPECKGARVDTLHMFWHCHRWNKVRKKYTDAMDRYITKVKKASKSRYEQLWNMMSNGSSQRCGICPGNEDASKKMHDIQVYDPRNDNLIKQPNFSGHANSKYEVIGDREYAYVYTDGSCMHGAGWGLYFAEGCPLNCKSMLHGAVQTSYRAEVRALLHVVRTSIIPTVIMIDCKSVVNIINGYLEDRTRPTQELQEQDLWDCIFEFCANSPKDFFIAQWIPSHLDEEVNKERRIKAIEDGLVTAHDIEGNCRADALAKEGTKEHISIDYYVSAAAADRKRITIAAQRMYLEIWSKFLENSNLEQQEADIMDTDALAQCLEKLEFDAGMDEFDYDPFAEDENTSSSLVSTQEYDKETLSNVRPAGHCEHSVITAVPNNPPADSENDGSHVPGTEANDETDETQPIFIRFPHYGWAANNVDNGITYGWHKGSDSDAFGTVRVPGVRFDARQSTSKRKNPCYRVSMELCEPFVDWLQRSEWSYCLGCALALWAQARITDGPLELKLCLLTRSSLGFTSAAMDWTWLTKRRSAERCL